MAEMIEGQFYLLPPAADKCQECAGTHFKAEPHNAQSLFYQTKFQMEHGRGATWIDAMAHCDDPVKELWRSALMEMGVDVDAGEINPPKVKK